MRDLLVKDKELSRLGFVLQQTNPGIAGCNTTPCFGNKMPDQAEPKVPCAVIQSMCSLSPRQMMKGESHDDE